MSENRTKKKGRKAREKEEGTPLHRLKVFFLSVPYTVQVTVTFALIALMTAGVGLVVLTSVWNEHFQSYTRENIQELADTTAEAIETRYERTNADVIEEIENGATIEYPSLTTDDVSPASSAHQLKQSLAVQVRTSSGSVLYDSSAVSTGDSAIDFDTSTAESPDNDDSVASSPIIVNGHRLGTVRMWVYGSEVLLSKTDQEFRTQSYTAMVVVMIVSAAIASLIGLLFARGLVNPIRRMTTTAESIRNGDLTARNHLEGHNEIAELGNTFDEMAESIQNDRELEHRLVTDVAHELRTPLMAIKSTVECIIDGVFEPDGERLATINSEVDRLSRLVDALLKLSRLESGETQLNREVVNVGEMIRPLISVHEAFVKDRGLELVYEAEDNVMVYGDADMLRQATANLISNAVRYTPAPGTITVRVKKDEDDEMALIAVQDTGIGLSPEERKKVFRRFWRAEESRKRESGGLGIGLSVVKEIVDRHGGWVQVEGEKNVGACFTIHVPLYDYNRIKAEQKRENGVGLPQGKAWTKNRPK